MALQILKFPNDILKKTASDVEVFDDKLKELINEMKHTVYVYRALGLAAPQVGHSIKAIVCNLSCGTIEMINPQIRPVTIANVASGGGVAYEYTSIKEGCLSVPGVYNDVKRHKNIEVVWQDVSGEQRRAYFDDKDAIIIQHEVDHLQGVLFIDRLGALRNMLLQKYFKVNKK